MKQYKKVLLAYSGGLDTSIIIPWLKENYGCEVIAATKKCCWPIPAAWIHPSSFPG